MRRRRTSPISPGNRHKHSPGDEGYVTDVMQDSGDKADLNSSDACIAEEPEVSGYYDTDADENGNLAGFVVDDEVQSQSGSTNNLEYDEVQDDDLEPRARHAADESQEADAENGYMDVEEDDFEYVLH